MSRIAKAAAALVLAAAVTIGAIATSATPAHAGNAHWLLNNYRSTHTIYGWYDGGKWHGVRPGGMLLLDSPKTSHTQINGSSYRIRYSSTSAWSSCRNIPGSKVLTLSHGWTEVRTWRNSGCKN